MDSNDEQKLRVEIGQIAARYEIAGSPGYMELTGHIYDLVEAHHRRQTNALLDGILAELPEKQQITLTGYRGSDARKMAINETIDQVAAIITKHKQENQP